MGITDEALMAYADGALGPEEAAAVARAVAADAGLATKLAMLAGSRAAVQRAYAQPPAVSADLAARVRAIAATDAALCQGLAPQGKVIDLAARRRVVPFWQLPLAASVALAVGLGSAWFMGPNGAADGASGGLQVAALADPSIAAALDSLASGDETAIAGGARLAAIASFHDADGTLCREFEHGRPGASSVVAVACRTEAAWDVRFAIAAAAPDATGYAPASSLEALDAFLTATGAGAPLSAAEETAALQALR